MGSNEIYINNGVDNKLGDVSEMFVVSLRENRNSMAEIQPEKATVKST